MGTISKAMYGHVLDRNIDSVMESYFPEHKVNRGKINFKCNVCGDSKKRQSKMRAWILPESGDKPKMFHCFNCSTSFPAEYWLKLYFRNFYDDYIKEAFKLDFMGKDNQAKQCPSINPVINHTVEEVYDEFEDTRHFRVITKPELMETELFKIAIDFCHRRKIPSEVWSKWYVAIDGVFKNRIVIPFYDNNNKIYGYQCRSLFPWMEPKYLGRKNCSGAIYNFYNVNFENPVVVLEGMIDSIFIENAIGVTGLKVYMDDLDKVKRKYFLLDDDPDGRRVSEKLLLDGQYVFLWSKFLKKFGIQRSKKSDINDIYIKLGRENPFKFNELRDFFTNSLFDRIHLI